MMQLIKIIFVFILALIFGQSLGLFLNNRLELGFKKYYFFIGLIAIWCIYEILMIFPLIFNLSSIFSYMSGFVVVCVCIFSLFVERTNFILELKNQKYLHYIFLMGLTLLIFFISGNAVNDFNDTFFYESFITENTKAATLNYINIFQSGYVYVDYLHAYDAFYHLLALISNVFRIKPYLLITWLMPFVYSVSYFSTYAEIIEHFNFKFNRKILLIPIYISVIIGLFKGFDLIYVGNFYNPLIMSIIILLLSKDNLSIKQSIFLSMCFVAGISTQSTFIIYSIIIIVAKAFHIILSKADRQITNMCIYMCPVLFFSFLIIINNFHIFETTKIIYIFAAVFAVLLSYLLNKVLNIKRLKICCVLFSAVIYIGSIYLLIVNQYKYGPQDFLSSLDPFNVGYDYISVVIEILALVIIVYKSIYSKSYNYFFVLITVVLLLFFNPLTITFISTYLTDEVYIRVFNVCTCFVIFIYSMSLVKNVYGFLLIALFVIYQKPYEIKNIELYDKNEDYLLYRMSYDSYNAFNKLNELTKQFKDKYGVPPSTFAPDLRAEFITDDAGYIYNLSTGRTLLIGDRSKYVNFREEQISDLYAALTQGESFENPAYISNVISNQVIKFVLIDSDQTNEAIRELENVCKLDYKNNSYRLYSCNQK